MKSGQNCPNPVLFRNSNFVTFHPILMKLVSNCTILRSRSPILGSKSGNFTSKVEIRKNFSQKSGFCRRPNFPDLPRTGFCIWGPNGTKNRRDLGWRNSTLVLILQAGCVTSAFLLYPAEAANNLVMIVHFPSLGIYLFN